MKRYKYLRPYVRKAKRRDYGADTRTAIRLAFRLEVGFTTYVMVQRGCKHRAIACGGSKLEVEQSPMFVRLGRMTFKQWSKSIQRICCRG